MNKTKTSKQLERHFKGIANHRRLDILFLIKNFDGLTLQEIADRLGCNFKTISGHTKTLVNAGLLDKKYKGRRVAHSLSPYGQKIIELIETFSHS
jgi:DNA-binding MarR family transcriptional regulator